LHHKTIVLRGGWRFGDYDAIVPAIRGSAFITGIAELYVDPDDPFPEGYLLSDTWPGDDLQWNWTRVSACATVAP
jgi:hypothetical protein